MDYFLSRDFWVSCLMQHKSSNHNFLSLCLFLDQCTVTPDSPRPFATLVSTPGHGSNVSPVYWELRHHSCQPIWRNKLGSCHDTVNLGESQKRIEKALLPACNGGGRRTGPWEILSFQGKLVLCLGLVNWKWRNYKQWDSKAPRHLWRGIFYNRPDFNSRDVKK